MTAADDYNARQIAGGALTIQHVTELVRFWQLNRMGAAAVDGMAGPQTIGTIESAIVARTPPGVAPFLACPLPVLPDTRRAVITSGFRPPDRANHDGCDWFYPWRPGDQPSHVGDHGAEGRNADGSPRWVVPLGVRALAAGAGAVVAAANSATGWYVWLDHGNGLRSGYFHLLDVRVRAGQHVELGAELGLVGDNPSDADGRHLHFEVSPVERYSPVDPERYLLPGASAHP